MYIYIHTCITYLPGTISLALYPHDVSSHSLYLTLCGYSSISTELFPFLTQTHPTQIGPKPHRTNISYYYHSQLVYVYADVATVVVSAGVVACYAPLQPMLPACTP